MDTLYWLILALAAITALIAAPRKAELRLQLAVIGVAILVLVMFDRHTG